MPATLLRPYLLSYKNRLFAKQRELGLSREIIAVGISLVMMYGIHIATSAFLRNLLVHPAFSTELLGNLLRVSLLGFFVVLLFSSAIVALSSLYMSHDLPLLLSSPVAPVRLFFAKLVEITVTSSWIFLLFMTPLCSAYYQTLHLSTAFLWTMALLALFLMFIPAALGMFLVTIFVNILPPYRMRDLLVLVSFFGSCALLYFGQNTQESLASDARNLNEFIVYLENFRDPQPWWFPPRWAAEILDAYIGQPSPHAAWLWPLLIGTTVGITAMAYLAFDLFFRRGLTIAGQGSKHPKIYGSALGTLLGRALIPFHQQLRALVYKDARMFIRDTTQALQLLMLLLLTFMYLYNFRALRSAAHFSDEGAAWWEVVLAMANMAFGGCVVAAVSTRFVFPSVSLEGRTYQLLLSTPLQISQLLRYKFITWVVPVSILSMILLVSGCFAIQASIPSILVTAVVGAIIAFGITGLGIGSGAVYARFDWESPAQVSASFGSLVYMLLSLTVIILSLIPALFIFILTAVTELSSKMSTTDYWLAMGGSFLLLILIHYASVVRALSAGESSLKDMADRL